MLFFSAERLLGTQRALLLACVALLPGLDWPVILFLDLWRTSSAVGQELLSGTLSQEDPCGAMLCCAVLCCACVGCVNRSNSRHLRASLEFGAFQSRYATLKCIRIPLPHLPRGVAADHTTRASLVRFSMF